MSVAPIRSRTSYFSAGTSKSLSYTEGTALDNTHLLVAVVQVAHATAISSVTPSGWTELSGGGANSTNQVRIYARQGDGTTNSISITSSSAVGAITLLAFEGYTSLTPLYAAGAAGTASTSRTVSTGTVSGYGVAITAIGVVGTVTWGSWTGATRAGSIANASQRLDVGWSLYDDEGNAKVTHTLTWGTSRTQYIVGVVLPIATPTSPQPLMAFSFDENSGGFARDSVSGTLTTDIGLWATGHTNSGVMNPNGDAGAYPDGPDSTTTEWTFMAWGKVQSASASGTRQIMLAHDPDQVADNIIHVEVATNGMLKLLVMQDTTWSMLTTTDLGTIDTAWHHFALVRHGQAVQLYIDGWPVSYLPTAYTTAAQNMALMGFGLAANWNNADAVYADDLRIFDKALSRAQIQTFQATPVPAAIVPVTPDLPTPVAHTSVSALGVDTSLSPALPANSLSYIALVNRHEGTNAPDGWTLIHNEQTTDTDGTHYSIWHANAPVTAPSWVIGTNGANDEPYSALVMGYDRATMVSNFTFNSDNVVSPSVTTTEPGTLVRTSIDGNDSSSAPGFPVNATLGRAENSPYSATWSATVAIAHEYRETPGATGTATWSIPVEWKAFSSTFLLTEVAAPTNLPMAAYNFNEGTGNSAEDASGNGYTLSVTGTASSAWDATGHTGSAASAGDGRSFARSSGFGSGTLTDWTFMAWYKPYGTLSNSYGQLFYDNQNLWAEITTSNNVGFNGTYSQDALATGVWAHIAFVGTGNSVKTYIDGVLAATSLNWAQASINRASSYSIGTGGDGPLNGAIDDVRLFSGALTAQDIYYWRNTPVQSVSEPVELHTPVVAYGFNEGTGSTTADLMGNGRTASVSAWTTGRTSTGAIGNATESAMRFSGSLIPAASAVTMMFWAYPTSAPQDQSLGSIGSGPGGDDLWMQPYWGDATHLHLGVRTSAGWYGVQSSVTTPLNAWVHVAVSWNHATNSASIFINGIETGTVTTEGILSDIDWLEAGGWAAASNFNVGTVDDLRVFDAALSSAEVTEWMNTPISGAPTPLPISQYGFNEGSGGYARDSSGNNRTIAVDSTKWTATSKNGPGIVGNAFAHAVLGPSILTARTIMFWLTIDASPPSGSYDNIITSGVMEETGRFEALYLNQDSVDGPQIGYYWQNGSGQTFNVEYNTPAGYSSSSAHIAITTGPAGLAVYFNGQQIGAASGFTTVMGLSDVHMSESGTHLLQGTIDELRTFDAALDSTKITYWMNTPVAGIAPARTTPQPIAAYGFNEGTGTTAVDSSGGSHTLPVVSSAWSSNGKTGNAVTGQAFSNANIGPNSLTARTTMFWIRMSALPAFEGIVDLIGSGNVNSAEAADVIYLYKSTSGGSTIALGHYFKAPSGGTSLDDSYTVTIPLNTYVHIACVNGPGGAQLYFNGVIQGIVSSSVAAVGMNEISMGSSTYPANNVILDELRFFNSELTGDEITYWMNTSILSSAQPIAAYGFHETSGTSIADSSPNNNTLTIGSGYLGGGEYTSEGENSPGAYRLTFNNPTTEGTIMGHIIPGTDQFLNAEESLFGFWSNDGDPGGSTYFALWRNRTSFGGSSGLQGNVRIAGTLHEIASNEVLLPGGHYHVALSFGPTGTRIYLDGVEVGAYPGLTGPLSSGGQFSLGADNDNTVFDDVRVFDKQLSLAEINSWRSTPVAAPGSGEPSTQTVVWRGRAGGATVTFVRAAVRIGGQTVPIINGAMRVSGSTVPLRLGSTSQSPFDVLGSSSVGRVGSGAITVPLPAGSGGSVIIFLSGNQLSEPSIPAGWTKINWSTANPAVATGIYQRTSPSANPTFNVTQPVDGGIAAVAFRVRGQINAVSAVGSTDVVTSPSATSSAQSLVVRTIVSSLDEPVETTLSFPVGTHNQQSVLTGGNDAGTMVAGAISKVVNASTASGTAVWSLNNIGTSRAATWLLEIT